MGLLLVALAAQYFVNGFVDLGVLEPAERRLNPDGHSGSGARPGGWFSNAPGARLRLQSGHSIQTERLERSIACAASAG